MRRILIVCIISILLMGCTCPGMFCVQDGARIGHGGTAVYYSHMDKGNVLHVIEHRPDSQTRSEFYIVDWHKRK